MAQTPKKRTTGLILGKFYPPHLGHQYLVDFARAYVDDLTVLVGTLKAESIPGELRYSWMREMFPGVNVLHLTDENPQEPHEHPDFWTIWHDSIKRLCPQADFLFASETYGFKLAETLGMTYIPVNHARSMVPVSGTQIRQDPMKNWAYLPLAVRPYYAKRVCIFGPESTGKSTLAKNLAEAFNTVFVHEYARDLLDLKNGLCDYSDIELIAKGHRASEEALVRQANRVLISDTDLLTTVIWSEVLFGKCPPWLYVEADRRSYDLYLVCDNDVPWIADPQRYQPNEADRRAFFRRCIEELEKRNRRYVIIKGSWEERFAKAQQAVHHLLLEQKIE